MTRPSPLRLASVAAVVLAAGISVGAAWKRRERLRHIAVPVLADPSAASPPATELSDLAGCELRALARVPGRVTAILEEDATAGGDQDEEGRESLWVGTFDSGLFRVSDTELVALPGLHGRERFVNALASHDGLVWAATQGGLVAYDGERRALALLSGEAVTSLTRAGRSLYAGTARGLFRVSAGTGAEPVQASGPSGEPLRVTALAATATTLWIGTASGAYSLPLATAEAPLLARTARWQPLVFGDPPAETNVVTALAALGDGALAGTDDGGVVRLRDDGRPVALRFADAPANEINPGAACAATVDAAVVGTQGGGTLLVRVDGERPMAWRLGGDGAGRSEVSAVRVLGERILVATASGAIAELRCELLRNR